jgi:hypothetical protein
VIWAAPTANAGMFLAEIAAGLIGPIGEPSVDALDLSWRCLLGTAAREVRLGGEAEAADVLHLGNLQVADVKVRKVSVQKDGIWTQVPRYTVEGMDIIPSKAWTSRTPLELWIKCETPHEGTGLVIRPGPGGGAGCDVQGSASIQRLKGWWVSPIKSVMWRHFAHGLRSRSKREILSSFQRQFFLTGPRVRIPLGPRASLLFSQRKQACGNYREMSAG